MKTFGPASAKTSATSASHSRTGKRIPAGGFTATSRTKHEGERREEEGRLPLREPDGHLGGVEAEEQPAQHVDTVLGGDGDRLDGAVVGQQRLLADRGREPGTGERALQGQDEEPRGHGQPGQQPLAARRGGRGAAQARSTQDQGHGQALGARQRHERPRHGEAGGAPAAPPGEPAVEQQQGEEEEEGDVRAVEVSPDDRSAEGDEAAGEKPLALTGEAPGHARREGDRGEVERRPEEDGEGDEPLAPRAQRRGRGRGSRCGGGSWRRWSAPRRRCTGRGGPRPSPSRTARPRRGRSPGPRSGRRSSTAGGRGRRRRRPARAGGGRARADVSSQPPRLP